MTDTISGQFSRWFEYERDSHSKTLASLETVPPERRSEPDFQRAAGLLAHLVAARMLWLFRLGQQAERPAEMFPKNVSVADLRKQVREMEGKWLVYLDRIDDDEMRRIQEYQSLDAGRFSNSVHDILTQLFGHSWYHRGQIALLVRSLGGTPAVTDFIYWARTPTDG